MIRVPPFRPLFARLIRFGVVGLGVTALHVLVAVSLVELSLSGPPAANGIAFVVATCISFIINARFTFRSRLTGGTFVRFLFVTGLCGALSTTIAALAEDRGVDYRIGITLVVAIVPILSFLLHNLWSFRRP